MMKKYMKPDFTVQKFDVCDVITASVENTLETATVEGATVIWSNDWNITDNK